MTALIDLGIGQAQKILRLADNYRDRLLTCKDARKSREQAAEALTEFEDAILVALGADGDTPRQRYAAALKSDRKSTFYSLRAEALNISSDLPRQLSDLPEATRETIIRQARTLQTAFNIDALFPSSATEIVPLTATARRAKEQFEKLILDAVGVPDGAPGERLFTASAIQHIAFHDLLREALAQAAQKSTPTAGATR